MDSQDAPFFKALGSRITAARKAQNLTQQQLADQLGVAQQTYAQWETGRARIQVDMLPKLAKDLNVSLDELIGVKTGPRSKSGPANKFEQRIERMRKLPRTKQQIVLDMLDAFLAKASH
jgi:transcriptional regulator with XRE-family HTH domain